MGIHRVHGQGSAWLALTILLAASPVAAQPAAEVENTIGMRFVLVPAGTFRMGSDERPESLGSAYPAYAPQRFAALRDETPAHEVRITRAFYMARFEVTVGQFRRFLEASGYRPEAEADRTGGYGYNPDYRPELSPRRDAFEGRDPRYSWRSTGFAQSEDHPVVNVTWNDAVALAEWLTRREGHRYRLPTEAEWEYACRAGATTRYSAGDDPLTLLAVGNTFDTDAAQYWPQWAAYALPGRDGFAFTAPVGRFPANAFGVHDLHGNVWEWVNDWYDGEYYARSPAEDPPGPAAGTVRVRRGGSWHTWPLYARCAMRNWNTPDSRYTLVGIRLVRETAVAPVRTAQPPRGPRTDPPRRPSR